jgi:UDP-3-O-[3-hydroxymyristoyl] glucosamine N-acyltransferase
LVAGELTGDGSIPIRGAAILRDAQPGDITLADGGQFLEQLAGCPATAAVVPRGVRHQRIPHIAVDDVHVAFARIVTLFKPLPCERNTGISTAAWVSPTAKIGSDATVHAGATVADDVEIGDRTVIHTGVRLMAGCKIAEDVIVFPNAVLYENTIVGPRAIIHGGAVLGAYGFGYRTVDSQHKLSYQLGHVQIEADVEIGACTTIDRGTYGPTVIGEGTKIDNHVMIAHNCRIGRHNLLCSQVGIAGSCVTGDYVVMCGQVGLRDHLTIGEGAILGAQSGHIADVEAGARVVGSPAAPEREFWHGVALTRKLPELRRSVKQMQRELRDHVSSEALDQMPSSNGDQPVEPNGSCPVWPIPEVQDSHGWFFS